MILRYLGEAVPVSASLLSHTPYTATALSPSAAVHNPGALAICSALLKCADVQTCTDSIMINSYKEIFYSTLLFLSP